jgi:hypothetical protein
MKKRLLKTGIILATATLVMINIQLLFDTSDNPLLQGSTAKASDEYYYYDDQEIDRFIPKHMLDNIKCWDFDLQVVVTTVPIRNITIPLPVGVQMSLETDGRRWACEKINEIIYCDSYKISECKPVDSADGEEVLNEIMD